MPFARFLTRSFAARRSRYLGQCRLVLHGGLHKTGSTFLQQQCSASRRTLMERGILFPSTGFSRFCLAGGRAGKSNGHDEITSLFRGGDWDRAACLMVLLSKEAQRASCRNILLSMENLTYARRSQASNVARFFLDRFEEVDVVIYLRRWDRWIESLYKERLNGGETRDFRTFISEESWLLDYVARLEKWSPPEEPKCRLQVCDYEESIRDPGLWAQFFHDVFPGIEPPFQRAATIANPSINAAQAEALRQFNIEHANAPGRWDALDALYESDFAVMEGESGILSRTERSDFVKEFEEQNRLLRERFGVDLLG